MDRINAIEIDTAIGQEDHLDIQWDFDEDNLLNSNNDKQMPMTDHIQKNMMEPVGPQQPQSSQQNNYMNPSQQPCFGLDSPPLAPTLLHSGSSSYNPLSEGTPQPMLPMVSQEQHGNLNNPLQQSYSLDCLDLGLSVGADQPGLDLTNSTQSLTQSAYCNADNLQTPAVSALNLQQPGSSFSNTPLTGTSQVFPTPTIVESMTENGGGQSSSHPEQQGNPILQNQHINVGPQEPLLLAQSKTPCAGQQSSGATNNIVFNHNVDQGHHYETLFPHNALQALLGDVHENPSQVNQSRDTRLSPNSFTHFKSPFHKRTPVLMLNDASDRVQQSLNNMYHKPYASKRPRLFSYEEHRTDQFGATPTGLFNSQSRAPVSLQTSDPSMHQPLQGGYHQFNEAQTAATVLHGRHVSMSPESSIFFRPQQSLDPGLGQVQMLPQKVDMLRQNPSTPEPFYPLSQGTYSSSARGITMYPTQLAFELNSMLDSQSQPLGMGGRNVGATVPNLLESSSSKNKRGKGKQVQQWGNSMSSGFSGKGANGQEWTPLVLNPQPVNMNPISQANEGQNFNVLNPYAPKGQVKNGAYDIKYAELGLPVDPHLRLFLEKQKQENDEHNFWRFNNKSKG